MNTCIPSHRFKRSWRSCPKRMNASNKTGPACTIHKDGMWLTEWECDYLNGWIKKRSHTQKNLIQNCESQRYSWELKNNMHQHGLFVVYYSLVIFLSSLEELGLDTLYIELVLSLSVKMLSQIPYFRHGYVCMSALLHIRNYRCSWFCETPSFVMFLSPPLFSVIHLFVLRNHVECLSLRYLCGEIGLVLLF